MPAARRITARYRVVLDDTTGAEIRVEFTRERRTIVDYAVVLVIEHVGESEVVRLYDGSHDANEPHRYTLRAGKQAAEVFHPGTLETECARPSRRSVPATRR